MNHYSAGAASGVLRAAAWRKSSFSNAGECVSVAEVGGRIAVRNSKRPEAGTLLFTRHQLAAWIEGCKADEFHDLSARSA